MTRQISIDDKYWPEVDEIHSYAIFMGYLLMGVRGLSLLVFTWTTVVLLGGFVSILQREDFWCLTIITLVQTARAFDFLSKETSNDIVNFYKGLVYAIRAKVSRKSKKKKEKTDEDKNPKHKQPVKESPSTACKVLEVLASIFAVVQLPVHAIVLCPLAVLFMLGLYISTGISLWRLIQQADYGNADGGTNLNPALNVLYSLAVAQGVVYGYRWIYGTGGMRTRIAEKVARCYLLETYLVSEYLEETVTGFTKDPSFVRGRNLVTYAVDLLMESKSRQGYMSGVLILGKILDVVSEQRALLKQILAGSASFGHVVQRLLETFGPTSPYSTEIRVRAARIVATVAGSIRLEQFPAQRMMIQYVSSLLDTSEHSWRPEGYEQRHKCRTHGVLPKEYERWWLLDEDDLWYTCIDGIPCKTDTQQQDSRTQGYNGLVVQGLCILQGLAVDEDNCRVITNNQDLLSKAIAPLLISDQPHSSDHHDEDWSIMAEESLALMKRLMAAPYQGETETKLINEVLGNIQIQAIIGAAKSILECLKCRVLLKRQAVEVLLDLSADTDTAAFFMPGGSGSSSTTFVWILLHISLLPDCHFDRMCGSNHLAMKSSCIARLAGPKMQALLPSETEASATSVSEVIRSLTTAVADAENNSYTRIQAATILEHLVRFYTKDDENLKQLKKAMTDVMLEVLKEIVVHARDTKGGCTQVITQANNGDQIPTAGGDLEEGGFSHDNGHESSSTLHQLQDALIHLCRETYFKWIDEDQELTSQFNVIAGKICSGQGMPDKNFQSLVNKAHNKLCVRAPRF